MQQSIEIPGSGSQTMGELEGLQRLMADTVMRPLTSGNRMQREWVDGRLMKDVADSFIKPNDYLSAFGRLELYNRQYWFRLIDSLFEDFPGLVAVIGERKFTMLVTAYLENFPSNSFTLRDLGSRMAEFVEANREMIPRRYELAIDMARLEWAHVEAFDSRSLETVTIDELAGSAPSDLRFRLQPYLRLLQLSHPVDELLLKVRRSNAERFRAEASNAAEEKTDERSVRAVPAPDREDVFLAVHRYENSVYYKRLRRDEFTMLETLGRGLSLEDAVNEGAKTLEGAAEDYPEQLQASFQTWSKLRWLAPS